MLESLFKKVVGLRATTFIKRNSNTGRPTTFLKRDSKTGVFLRNLQNF